MGSAQEEFWKGSFGDDYLERNDPESLLPTNIRLLSAALRTVGHLESILELGANAGNNLMALHVLFPDAQLHGIEINQKAFGRLSELPYVTAHHGSLLEFDSELDFDLVLVKGVLIHTRPDLLPRAYSVIEKHARRYVLLAEYYEPRPTELEYRGHAERLYKRVSPVRCLPPTAASNFATMGSPITEPTGELTT